MKKNKHTLWSLENGEILYRGLHRDSRIRFRADTPFDTTIAPYLIMFFCAAVDGAVFYSLFSAISYDSPLMLTVQIAGFLFGFDVVPIYLGIHLRRLRQGLTDDRFITWIALAVCGVVCAMNMVLRISVMDQLTPAVLPVSFLGTAVLTAEPDSTAAALTVFGIGIPVVTSMGSFFISYLTYDPLKIRSQREEILIAEKRDEIRRLEAILGDYDAEADYAEHLLEEDQARFEEMQRMQHAIMLGYCDYARLRLKEHLSDPAANSILSASVCTRLMERLDKEIAALESGEPTPNTTRLLPISPMRKVR